MSSRLDSLCFDTRDPARLARFWAAVLGWEVNDQVPDEIVLQPTDGTRLTLDFLAVPEPTTAKCPIHLDLVSESVDHQRQLVEQFIGLGAHPADIGQGDVPWAVLADPEGNEFCIILRGEFFADTGFLGSVVFEPAHPSTGSFWGAAMGWPIVYDQDGDVAIRAPDGQGPFLTFGPPGVAKSGKNRLHLDLRPPAGEDHEAEVERLIELGATRVDIGQGDVPWVVLADPDGNELCVLTPR